MKACMISKVFISLSVLTLLSGCATFTSPARKHELSNGTVWLDYDSTRRGALIVPVDNKGKYQFCSEPSPDVALTLANKISGDVSHASGATAKGEINVDATAVELAGRTQTVLFAREALFRLCEASLSQAITSDQYYARFDKILDTIKDIATAEKNRTEANSKAANAALNALQVIQLKGADAAESKAAIRVLETLKSN